VQAEDHIRKVLNGIDVVFTHVYDSAIKGAAIEFNDQGSADQAVALLNNDPEIDTIEPDGEVTTQ